MSLPTRAEVSLALATRTLRDVLAITEGAKPMTRLGAVRGTVKTTLKHLQHTAPNDTQVPGRQLTLGL